MLTKSLQADWLENSIDFSKERNFVGDQKHRWYLKYSDTSESKASLPFFSG